MDAITFTINGNTISARAEKTILEVARDHGIYIPTLCHHDLLRPIGACRLCQVEDEKRNMVVPACVTKIQQGMVINTDSPRVVRNRKNIIRLLLAAHPESCVVCEKGNQCELRRLAAQMGIGTTGLDPMPYDPTVLDINPFLSRDLSKCILCAKCIRADKECVVEGVLDYTMRGFDAHPSTIFHQPLEGAECTFCGTCLSVCPTAAIAEKGKIRLGHASARTRSVCSFCACGCSIYLKHDHSSVLGVAPTSLPHTANGISLCVKGHFGHDYLNSPERLRTPLVKTEDGFQPVSWEDALDRISENLARLRDQHGPGALGFVGGSRSTNEENYLFQKFARSVLGANNIDTVSSGGWGQASRYIRESTGFAAGSNSFRDLELSDAILVIGADPTQTAPVMGFHIKRAARREQTKLIVIDPVDTRLTSFADIVLKPNIASDYYLLRGILKVILEEELFDEKFVLSKTSGFDALKENLKDVSVLECAQKSGVGEKDLRDAARVFSSAMRGSVVFGAGVMDQPQGAELVKLLVDLILLTGNLGKERAGFYPVLKDCNTQGANDMGVRPDFLPGYSPVGSKNAEELFNRLWSVPPPASAGLNVLEMVSAAKEGALKGMFVFCENPLRVLPDCDGATEAFANLEFLVVQDMFLSETARLADVVLPAAAFAEKEGTVTNLERRVQRLHQAVPAPDDSPPQWQTFMRLAEKLGQTWSYGSVGDILQEIIQAVPVYSGAESMDLDSQSLQWPLPGLEEVVDTLPHGIGHKNGKAVFLIPESEDGYGVPEEKEYPFVLMQGHILQRLGSGLRSSHSKRLRVAAAQAQLGINPSDMESLSIQPGETVKVISANGSVEIPAAGDQRLPRGLAFLPASFPELAHTALFGCDWSRGKTNIFRKHCRVKVEKL